MCTLFKFTATSAALHKLRRRPFSSQSPISDPSDGGSIVIFRGTVDGTSKTLRPSVLVSRKSSDKGVVLQRTQTLHGVCPLFSASYLPEFI